MKKKQQKKNLAWFVSFLVTQCVHILICFLQMALLNPEIQPAGMGTSFSQPNIPFCVRESSDFTLDETLDVNSLSSDSSREQVMCTR